MAIGSFLNQTSTLGRLLFKSGPVIGASLGEETHLPCLKN